LKNIGGVHKERGEYEKALELFNKCLEIEMKKLGADSIQVATTLNNIGMVYDNRGEYEKALEQYNKCMEIQMKKMGVDSIQVA
jgi:tetratricopeptide (TPR) repeat protein